MERQTVNGDTTLVQKGKTESLMRAIGNMITQLFQIWPTLPRAEQVILQVQ